MFQQRSALIAASLVVACGQPTPDGMTLEIIPAEPSTFDALVAVIPSQALGEGVTYTYVWSVNGSAAGDVAGAMVPPERTTRGEVWSVVATPTSSDGKKVGAIATSEVTIRNTPPVSVRVSIDDDAPTSSDDIKATPVGSDIDGDELSWTFTWYVNGDEVQSGTSDTLAVGNYIDGDFVDVQAIGSDGEDQTTPVRSAPVRVRNSPPRVISVAIESAEPDPHGFTDLTCIPTETFDQDGDELSFFYEWRVNGEKVQRADATVNRIAKRGDAVTCLIRAYDTKAFGEWTESPAVTLVNTPPAVPELRITPEDTTDSDSMVCSVRNGLTDWDGDALTFTFTWTKNGTAWSGPTRQTVRPGDTIDDAYTFADDSWTCEAISSDGSLTSAMGVSPAALIRVSWDGPRNFTNCAKTGATGPSQSQCDTAYRGGTLEAEVTVRDGIQEWVVPATGRYLIEAKGARGAVQTTTWGSSAGNGAVVSGEFELTEGDRLRIAVGQQGSTGGNQAGGGGGTFIVRGDEPLLIAGGGGACGYYCSDWGYSGCNASTTEFATLGAGSSWSSCRGVKTDRRAEGGLSGCYFGEGGGGFNSNGQGDTCWGSSGGQSWKNGARGGEGWSAGSGDGGFGGGGSGAGSEASGGGGGYSGGDASRYGAAGGGGSYNGGENRKATASHTGHGAVLIDLILD
jgi:hypothetical protein